MPTTMILIALLFMEKAVGLAREATARDAAQPEGVAAPPPPPPSATMAPSGTATKAPAVNPAELQLLQDLRRRRELLDQREHGLDQKADLLHSAQMKLETRFAELTALQDHLQQMEDSRRSRETQSWDRLVKTYEDMKPRDAAAIFDVLDMHVLLEVVDRMEERKAAAVLAAMLPERARLTTQMLAQKRTRQDANPAAPAMAERHDQADLMAH